LKIIEYNREGFVKDKMAENLIQYVVKDLESGTYDSLPKQNVLIERLRTAGWDHKVTIGENCNHSIDGILEKVGVCGYFGHQQAAFQKLLAFQSLYADKKIKECYYITQTSETAELRHRLVSGIRQQKKSFSGNGNRITLEGLSSAMSYYHRFITIPMTIIGIEITESQIRLK